jgi:hypothetical protein
MNRLPETIKTKFTELFNALNCTTDDLKIAGAEANLVGDFSQVAAINDSCIKLQALEVELKTILKNFESTHKNRSMGSPAFNKQAANQKRKRGGHLRVKVADKVIEESTIADTFVNTLRVFGLERVARLNKTVTSVPLLAKAPANGYQSQKCCDGWYVTTHVNKHTATTTLEEIGKELNIPIAVELITT